MTLRPASDQGLAFFDALVLHTRQGFYGDPVYGGNRNSVGWSAIGFRGPRSLQMTRGCSCIADGSHGMDRRWSDLILHYGVVVSATTLDPLRALLQGGSILLDPARNTSEGVEDSGLLRHFRIDRQTRYLQRSSWSAGNTTVLRANPSYPFAATSVHFCRYVPTPPKYGMNTCGLPGIFRPIYQELAAGISVAFATSATCAVHCTSASRVASIVSTPFFRMCSMQSEIHSTCCSIDTVIAIRTCSCTTCLTGTYCCCKVDQLSSCCPVVVQLFNCCQLSSCCPVVQLLFSCCPVV